MVPKKSSPLIVNTEMKKVLTPKITTAKFSRGPKNIKAQPMLTHNYLTITSHHDEMVKKVKLTIWAGINKPTYPKIAR